jgi:hypothetical protein
MQGLDHILAMLVVGFWAAHTIKTLVNTPYLCQRNGTRWANRCVRFSPSRHRIDYFVVRFGVKCSGNKKVSFNAKINVLIVAFFAIGIKTNAPGSFIVLVLTVVISVSSGLLSVHLM